MKTNTFRGALLASTFIVGALAAPAFAQTALDQTTDQSSDATKTEDTIVVTGSRLKQNNLISVSPMTQIDAAQISARGTTRVEDIVNILPQAYPGQTSQISNGASGTATVDLRGLGATRTLVLIDGKRLPFGSPSISAPDLNMVPASMIERVDVLTGGASAVYGSDAISGVVNFILKKNFEGVEFDGQVSYFNDGNSNGFAQNVAKAGGQPFQGGNVYDGRNYQLSMTVGANSADGRGNVTANLTYQSQHKVIQANRDFSACAFGLNNGPQSSGGVACIGSSTSATGRFFSLDNFSDTFLQPDGTVVPFTNAPSQTFNFNPLNDIVRPDSRYTFTLKSHYDITPGITTYLDFNFLDDTTNAQIAPSGTFFANGSVNCSNPFLGSGSSSFFNVLGCSTPGQTDANVLIGRRDVEGGPRNSEFDHQTFRFDGGFRGTIAKNFDWDVFGQFARTRETTISRNDISIEKLNNALNVVLDSNGNPVCASGAIGCVPYNVFQRGSNGESLVTQAAVNYILADAFTNGFVQQKVYGGTIRGDLADYGIKSPFAENGAQVVVGFEGRSDRLQETPDALSATPGGGLTGVGGASLPVAGKTQLFEYFTEATLPLVEGAPLAELIEVNGAYRHSHYKNTGNGTRNTFNNNTYSVGAAWVPIQDVRLRGQYQRAIRAPNVIELFSAQNTGLFDLQQNADGSFDDCAGTTPFRTLAECARTGVTAAQYGNIPDNAAGQFNQITGGNPNLIPEVGDTYTFGVILEPRFLSGFTLSVDYFDIKLKKAVGTVPPVQAFETCLDTGDPAFCSLIQRDAAGSLFIDNTTGGVTATAVNIARLKTQGFDITAAYKVDIGRFGSLDFSYLGTILDAQKFISVPGTPQVECKGKVSGNCGTPNFKYKHNARATWNSPYNFDLTVLWRYLDSVTRDGGPQGSINDKLSSQNYIDLSARYYYGERVTLRAGVNNLFDSDPPLSTETGAGSGNGNTYPGIYDSLGRLLSFGVNVKL